MKKIIGLVVTLLFSFLFFSCESKRDENGDLLFGLGDVPIDQGGTGVTKKLAKVTATDVDGEVTTINYTYEGDKIKRAALTSSEGNEILDVTYNGSVLKKFVTTATEAGETIKSEYTVIYEGTAVKQVTGDKSIGNQIISKSVSNFTYNASNKLTKVLTTINAVDPANPSEENLLSTIESDLLYSTANITKWRLETKMYQDTGSGPTEISSVVAETNFMNFDTNKNPFASLPIDFIFATSNVADNFGGLNGISANNPGKITAVVMGMNQALNYSYTYDGVGYPTKRTGEDGVVMFEYK